MDNISGGPGWPCLSPWIRHDSWFSTGFRNRGTRQSIVRTSAPDFNLPRRGQGERAHTFNVTRHLNITRYVVAAVSVGGADVIRLAKGEQRKAIATPADRCSRPPLAQVS
jgi:hypothetical protein